MSFQAERQMASKRKRVGWKKRKWNESAIKDGIFIAANNSPNNGTIHDNINNRRKSRWESRWHNHHDMHATKALLARQPKRSLGWKLQVNAAKKHVYGWMASSRYEKKGATLQPQKSFSSLRDCLSRRNWKEWKGVARKAFLFLLHFP